MKKQPKKLLYQVKNAFRSKHYSIMELIARYMSDRFLWRADPGARHAPDDEMMKRTDGVEIYGAGPVLVMDDGDNVKAV